MGCAESRNTVQPQRGSSSSAFAGVTPSAASASAASTAVGNGSAVSRLFQRTGGATAKPRKKHKANALVPEPLGSADGPSLPPATSAAVPTVASTRSAASQSRSLAPSIDAIAHAKPVAPTLASPVTPTTDQLTGPSLQLLPTDKQSLARLTLEELGIQFLKAVKNGDVASMDSIAQLALRSYSTSLADIRGMWDSTPLIYACQYGHARAAMWLLERGASAQLTNERGVTALLLASLEGMADVVDWILQQQQPSSSDILRLTTDTDSDIVSSATPIDQQIGVVYNAVADLNVRANPLLAASMNGHVEIAAKLLAHGAAVNCGVSAAGSTGTVGTQFPLLLAAKFGHARVVRLLLAHSADIATCDANGGHALLLACEASKEECAIALLQHLPSCDGVQTLAVVNPDVETLPVAEILAEAISDIQKLAVATTGTESLAVAETDARTAYFAAAAATWKQPNVHGLTALHFAAANGLLAVVQSMLVRLAWAADRAFVDATSVNRRECALLMACRKRQSEVVHLLLMCGADFALADRGGTTALQVLQRERKDELVRLCERKQQQQLASSAVEPVAATATNSESDAAKRVIADESVPVAVDELNKTDAVTQQEQEQPTEDTVSSSSSNGTMQLATVAAATAVDSSAVLELSLLSVPQAAAPAAAACAIDVSSNSDMDDLRTMSFAPHAPYGSCSESRRPILDEPSLAVATAAAAAVDDLQHTNSRVDEHINSSSDGDKWIVTQTYTVALSASVTAASSDSSLAVTAHAEIVADDSGATTSVALDAVAAVDTGSSSAAPEEVAIASSSLSAKRPSRPKHRKKEHTAPHRKPRQKKSVGHDDTSTGADTTNAGLQTVSSFISAAVLATALPSRSMDGDAIETAADSSAPPTDAVLHTEMTSESASRDESLAASSESSSVAVEALAPVRSQTEPSVGATALRTATVSKTSSSALSSTAVDNADGNEDEHDVALKRERRKKKKAPSKKNHESDTSAIVDSVSFEPQYGAHLSAALGSRITSSSSTPAHTQQ